MKINIKEPALRLTAWLVDKLAPNWPPLKELILTRTIEPLFRLKAVLYFLIAVCFFGGAGVWVTAILHDRGRATSTELVVAAASFAFPFATAAFVDCVLDEQIGSTVRMLILSLLLLAFVYAGYWAAHAWLNALPSKISWQFVLKVCTPALYVWWVSNANDRKFEEKKNASNAAGGDAMRALK
jgi:magnesium-transporting ATPase (P-type)